MTTAFLLYFKTSRTIFNYMFDKRARKNLGVI